MGRLSKELENKIEDFYSNNNGLLIAINDNFSEICEVSQKVSDFCDSCQQGSNQCHAGCPVISLGEIDPNLIGSGMSAVGLLDIKDQSICEIMRRRGKGEI